jgi:hypothetical protein
MTVSTLGKCSGNAPLLRFGGSGRAGADGVGFSKAAAAAFSLADCSARDCSKSSDSRCNASSLSCSDRRSNRALQPGDPKRQPLDLNQRLAEKSLQCRRIVRQWRGNGEHARRMNLRLESAQMNSSLSIRDQPARSG